jgi:hypothetical protein
VGWITGTTATSTRQRMALLGQPRLSNGEKIGAAATSEDPKTPTGRQGIDRSTTARHVLGDGS